MGKYWDSLSVKKSYCIVFASRGCPYGCIFCAAHVTNGKNIRKRSPKNFVSEIIFLNKKYGVDEFLFGDPTFNFDNKCVSEICEEILKMRNPIKWRCAVRADHLEPEIIKVMKKSGCVKVIMGVESADQKVLDLMKKQQSLEDIIKGLGLLKRLKMPVDPSFILGMPGETTESIGKTIKLAKLICRDPGNLACFSLATAFPGTELYRRAQGSPSLSKDFTKFDGFQVSYVPDTMTKDELRSAYRNAILKVYYNPLFLIKRALNMNSLHQLKINIRYACRILARLFK
jgi:radical SAM superfamily enzyme YgiQ (UPF0313 family)